MAGFTSFFPRWTDFDLTAKDIGMTQMIKAPSTELNSVPRMQIGDFTGIFGSVGGTLFSRDTDNQWNLAPSLTMTRGDTRYAPGGEFVYYARGCCKSGPWQPVRSTSLQVGRSNSPMSGEMVWMEAR